MKKVARYNSKLDNAEIKLGASSEKIEQNKAWRQKMGKYRKVDKRYRLYSEI